MTIILIKLHQPIVVAWPTLPWQQDTYDSQLFVERLRKEILKQPNIQEPIKISLVLLMSLAKIHLHYELLLQNFIITKGKKSLY